MLTDAKAFEAILRRNEYFRRRRQWEQQAKRIHEGYRKITDQATVASRINRDYENLEPAKKEDNRAAARRTPDILALIGLGVVREEDTDAEVPSEDEVTQLIKLHLERLAEAEHEGWMAQRILNGWMHGPTRDYDRRVHNCLVPYAKLSEDDREEGSSWCSISPIASGKRASRLSDLPNHPWRLSQRNWAKTQGSRFGFCGPPLRARVLG